MHYKLLSMCVQKILQFIKYLSQTFEMYTWSFLSENLNCSPTEEQETNFVPNFFGPKTFLQCFALFFPCSIAKHCRNAESCILGRKSRYKTPSMGIMYPTPWFEMIHLGATGWSIGRWKGHWKNAVHRFGPHTIWPGSKKASNIPSLKLTR